MVRRAGTTIGALLACCGIASALNPSLDINQYAHKAWTVREGFFKGRIHSVVQTADGYLWLGTEFGLFRFDGVRSVQWQPPAGQALTNSYVRTLFAARDGSLWIGTNDGLASWKDGKLRQYGDLAGSPVEALLEDGEGALWAGTIGVPTARLCVIRQGNVRCYGQDGSLGASVSALHDVNGHLWATTTAGLWQWGPGPPKLYPLPTGGRDSVQGLNDDKGRLLMSMRGGIRQLADGKFETYPVPGAGPQFSPKQLLRDRGGGLWIGTTDQGLMHLHQGKTDFFTQADGLSSDLINGIFEDREGNIWVASENGLDRFRDFVIEPISTKQGLASNSVWSVLAARDGSVWVGTRGALDRWQDGKIRVYSAREGLSDTAESLFEDDRGRIWIGTNHGVSWFDGGQFVHSGAVPDGQAHDIVGERAGSIWLSRDEGLVRLQGASVTEIPWAQLGSKNDAIAVLPDKDPGGVWLGFFLAGGVAYFKDGRVHASYSAADGLGKGGVTDLHFDHDGAVWAATEGGLTRIKDGRLATLTSRNGLPCDTVHWMREDNDHFVWLYMSCGLVRVARSDVDGWIADPKRTIQTMLFDGSDGVSLHSTMISGYAPRVARSTDGKLWFVSGDGVSVLDPRHLPFNKLPPPVHIEQITADRTTHDASPNLRLPALTRDLEIEYTGLSLVAPEKNRYRVKLEGWDRDWKDKGNDRKVLYSNLPPRNYRFRVMVSNNSGVWNETGASFNFSIAPAYYQTRWFQASCAAAFLIMLWALYRLRLHQIAQAFNARMEERVGERTRIARELHDTLLQSFQGLMLRLQVVEELLPEGRAKEELEQSLERADQAIAEGRSAVQDLRSSAVTTNDLAQAVRALGDELAGEDLAAFRLVVEGPTRDLHPIIRDEIYRIAREALRNAFSHAQAQHIEAEITYAERLFRLRIRDDGQGIAPAVLEEGRPGHYGLPGMRERASQIGAKLSIWSAVRAGTEIELSIAGSIAYGVSPGQSRLRLFRKTAR